MVTTYRIAWIIKRYLNWPSDSEYYIGGPKQIVINSDSSNNYNNSLNLLRLYYVPYTVLSNIYIISFNHYNDRMIANIIVTILQIRKPRFRGKWLVQDHITTDKDSYLFLILKAMCLTHMKREDWEREKRKSIKIKYFN